MFKFCRLFVSGRTAGGIFHPPTATLAPPPPDGRGRPASPKGISLPAAAASAAAAAKEALKVDSFFKTHRGLKFAYGGKSTNRTRSSWYSRILAQNRRPKSPLLSFFPLLVSCRVSERSRCASATDSVSQQTWPIISACHWELFRGINRAAAAKGGDLA